MNDLKMKHDPLFTTSNSCNGVSVLEELFEHWIKTNNKNNNDRGKIISP